MNWVIFLIVRSIFFLTLLVGRLAFCYFFLLIRFSRKYYAESKALSTRTVIRLCWRITVINRKWSKNVSNLCFFGISTV